MTANLAVANPPAKKTLHYRLTAAEWIRAVRELTESQKDVLYYIRTLNPFGDRYLNLGVRQLAEILDYSPSTISRALQALSEKGYILLEMVNVRVRILGKGQAPASLCAVPPKQQTLHLNNTCCTETTPVAPEQHPLHPCNNQSLEANPTNDSRTPHTIQSLKTTHSSSLSERGNFPKSLNPDKFSKEIRSENLYTCVENDSPTIGEQWQNVQSQKVIQPQTDIATDQFIPPPSRDPKNTGFDPANIPIYREASNPTSVKNGFIQHLQRWLSSIPPVRDRSRADALAYIRNQEATNDLSVLNCRAQEWLKEEARQREINAQLNARNHTHVHGFSDSLLPDLDLSDLITEIEIYCRRLNWSKQDAIDHMVDHCGWSAQSPVLKAGAFDRLLESDLTELLTELKTVKV